MASFKKASTTSLGSSEVFLATTDRIRRRADFCSSNRVVGCWHRPPLSLGQGSIYSVSFLGATSLHKNLRGALCGCASLLVLGLATTPTQAEQQVFRFFVNKPPPGHTGSGSSFFGPGCDKESGGL